MAENNNDDVELIDDETITLYDDQGNAVQFNEAAVLEYEGDFYALLQPVEPMEGLAEDEAIIFKIIQKDDETDEFEPVTDEAVLEAVFDEYLKAEARYADGCGCDDCDCDGCEDHCDCGDDCDCGCEHKHCDDKK